MAVHLFFLASLFNWVGLSDLRCAHGASRSPMVALIAACATSDWKKSPDNEEMVRKASINNMLYVPELQHKDLRWREI